MNESGVVNFNFWTSDLGHDQRACAPQSNFNHSRLETFANCWSGIFTGNGHKRHKNTNSANHRQDSKSKNSFCDFCAFCGEPAFLTKSHPVLKNAEHYVCRQNDLPRCEYCKRRDSIGFSSCPFVVLRAPSWIALFPGLPV